MIDPHDELQKMGIHSHHVQKMTDKDGIAVFQVSSEQHCYVLKVFDEPDNRREIRNHQILQALGVPTISVLASTEYALLFNDLTVSATFRLGRETDLADVAVARLIAKWYKALHTKGADFVPQAEEPLYDETDALTIDNMQTLQTRSHTEDNPFWPLLFARFASFRALLDALPRTLTYNDFYWTNLAVAKDGSEALMFDFNLLGKGYVYGDIRNVTSSLTVEAGKAFLAAYGSLDRSQRAIDEIVSDLFVLHTAYRRKTFPTWANNAVQRLQNGTLLARLTQLLFAL
jgi:hypothetical protein